MIDVVVVDKSPLIQCGMKAQFERDGSFRLVATASDGKRYLEAVGRLGREI